MNTEQKEQKKNDSVQKNKADEKDQQKNLAAKLGAAKKSNSEEGKTNSDVQDTKTEGFSLGENVHEDIHKLLSTYNELDLLITDKKDRLFFLQEMTKPISREQRKLGKKSPLTPGQRKAAKTEIKQLKSDLVGLEENRRNAFSRLTNRSDSENSTISNQKYRDYAQSDYYLRRNGKRIFENVVRTINEARTESMEEVVKLVRSAKANGSKSRIVFQSAFAKFLQDNDYQLYLLCTGKEAFKKNVVNKFRRSLKSWSPGRRDLSL